MIGWKDLGDALGPSKQCCRSLTFSPSSNGLHTLGGALLHPPCDATFRGAPKQLIMQAPFTHHIPFSKVYHPVWGLWAPPWPHALGIVSDRNKMVSRVDFLCNVTNDSLTRFVSELC